jgi:DUF971 family protein
VRLDLKKDERLEIQWQDGKVCTYSLTLLRTQCPCALCREQRQAEQRRPKTSLTVLPGNFSGKLTVLDAHLVGNYAIQLEWSDKHESGIYSFQYLREICPAD